MKHVRRRDIDKLSQGELLEAVKRSSLEKAIDTRTGPIALVLTFLFVAALYGIGIHDIAILVFAFFMGGLYIMLSINTLVDFRTRHFRWELLWRFGYRGTKRIEREAAAAFDASDGPDLTGSSFSREKRCPTAESLTWWPRSTLPLPMDESHSVVAHFRISAKCRRSRRNQWTMC